MVKRSWGPRAHPCATFVRSLVFMRRDNRRGEPCNPYFVETERSGVATQRVSGAKGSAILARSRSSSSSDLLSDKRYWERLSPRRPSSPQKAFQRFNTRGSILAVAHLSIQSGCADGPSSSARCWKCRHFRAQSNAAAAACALAANRQLYEVTVGPQSSAPRRRLARSTLSCAKRRLTHKSCIVNRKMQAASRVSSLISSRQWGAYVDEARWRVAQSLTRIWFVFGMCLLRFTRFRSRDRTPEEERHLAA